MYASNGLAIANVVNGNPHSKFQDVIVSYWSLMTALIFFPFLDILIAFIIMWALSCNHLVDDRSTWINCYYINCLCKRDFYQIPNVNEDSITTQNWTCQNMGSKVCCIGWSKNILHIFSMVFVTWFTQLFLFNSIFLTLAVIAAPIEAGSVLILYLSSLLLSSHS